MPGHPRRPTAPRFRMPWATVQSRTENACRHSLGRAISREATQRGCGDDMSRLWSAVVEGLTPYVPGEQPHVADLVKLNTNESPFGPSPRALEAIRAASTDNLRLYPDFDATELRETPRRVSRREAGAGFPRQRLGRGARAHICGAVETRSAAAVSGRDLQFLSCLLPLVRDRLRDGPGGRRDAGASRGLPPPGPR